MRSTRLLAVGTLTIATLAATSAGYATAASADTRNVAVGTRLAAQTDPAVRLITADYAAKLVVPSARPNKAFFGLVAKAKRHAKLGHIPADAQSQLKWVLRVAAAKPARYLRAAGPNRTLSTDITSLCTGWWITPNGYMVTGAHCVTTAPAVLRQEFAQQALPKLNQADTAALLKGTQPDAELVNLASTMFATFNGQHLRVTSPRVGYAVVDASAKGKPVLSRLNLVTKGTPYPGEDFALLKKPGARNLPTVPLGRDGDVRIGDNLYINGFPGLITNSPVFNFRSKLYPSLTEGAYNAIRTTVLGVPYLQSQAPSYHGNSGGPVFDRDGKVIGILIAGSVDAQTKAEAENHSFILPVGIVRKRLAAVGVKPVESVTTRVYNAALADYFAGRYRAALPKFRKVQALYPAHPYVGGFITDTLKHLK